MPWSQGELEHRSPKSRYQRNSKKPCDLNQIPPLCYLRTIGCIAIILPISITQPTMFEGPRTASFPKPHTAISCYLPITLKPATRHTITSCMPLSLVSTMSMLFTQAKDHPTTQLNTSNFCGWDGLNPQELPSNGVTCAWILSPFHQWHRIYLSDLLIHLMSSEVAISYLRSQVARCILTPSVCPIVQTMALTTDNTM